MTRDKVPPRTTTRLLGLLQQLKTDGSPLTVEDLRKGFGRFPVLGYVWYQDDFGAARYNPFYTPHAGTDLFAARGTPVMAVANGVVWKMNVDQAISGNGLWLREPAGKYYYYGHFDSFASGIEIGKRVKMGDIIGYVGNTGATHTAPHVHFEVHPDGTPEGAANPRFFVDRWLDDAEKVALRALGFGEDAATLGSFRWTELQGLLAGSASSPPALWGTALGGTATLGSLDLSLGALIASIDPSALVPVAIGDGASGSISAAPLSWLRAGSIGGHVSHLGD